MKTFLILTCICLAAFVFSGCASREIRTVQTEEYRGEGVFYDVNVAQTGYGKFPIGWHQDRYYRITQVAPPGCEWREVEEQCEFRIPYRLDTETGNLVTGGFMVLVTPIVLVGFFFVPDEPWSVRLHCIGCWMGTGLYNMNILVAKNSFDDDKDFPIESIWESAPRGKLLCIVPKGQWQPVTELRRRVIVYRTVELRIPSLGVRETFMTYGDGNFEFGDDRLPHYSEKYSKSYADIPAQIVIEPGTPNQVVIPFTIRIDNG